MDIFILARCLSSYQVVHTKVLTIEATLSNNCIRKIPNSISCVASFSNASRIYSFNTEHSPKAALAMMTINPCSLRLKGPGFRLHCKPRVVNARDGMILAQAQPRGYATNCTTIELMVRVGARSENRELSPDAIVVKSIPITHARIVLTGRSSS